MVGNGVPTVLGDGISALTCPGKFASLTACLNAGNSFVTAGKALRIEIPQGTYTLTSYPYSLASGMQIYGVLPTFVSAGGGDTDDFETPAGGTWIDCGGSQCFAGTGLTGVVLENLGFLHFGTVGVSFGAHNVAGLSASRLQNLYFVGSATLNGSGTALEIYNFQNVNADVIHAFSVNTGLHLVGDNSAFLFPGNSTFVSVYINTYAKSVANGNNTTCGLKAEALQGDILYTTFVRPQVVTGPGGDSTGSLMCLSGLDFAGVHDADLEGNVLNALKLVNTTQSLLGIMATSGTVTNTVNFDVNSVRNVVLSANANLSVTDANGASSSNIVLGGYLDATYGQQTFGKGAFSAVGSLSITGPIAATGNLSTQGVVGLSGTDTGHQIFSSGNTTTLKEYTGSWHLLDTYSGDVFNGAAGVATARAVLNGNGWSLFSVAYGSLPSGAPPFTQIGCTDCKNVIDDAAIPGANCVAGGSGTIARRENNTWRCN